MREEFTYEDAIKVALEIIHQVASRFYWSNQRRYKEEGIDLEDIEGFLKESILCKKYLPHLETNPEFHTKNSFRSSFYVSCKRACLTHIRQWLKTEKRGCKVGSYDRVNLDDEESLVQVESKKEYRHGAAMKMADKCKCPIAQRIVVLLAKECYKSKNGLKSIMPVSSKSFNRAWKEVQEVFSTWRHCP